jgi:DNA-directed RNA polymerase subunit H (RpoH/RPB5)
MSELNSTFVSLLYKSRNNLLSQLKTRGFDISPYENFSIGELNAMFKNEQMDMLLANKDGHKIFVKYNIHKNLSSDYVVNDSELIFDIERILNKETDSLIYIVKDEPNDTMIQTLTNLWNRDDYYVSVYNMKRLLFNILEHNMVPQHKPLNKAEIDDIIERYNLTDIKNQLPEISRFDPVAIAIGLKPGVICEITRNSKTSLETKYYRICV